MLYVAVPHSELGYLPRRLLCRCVVVLSHPYPICPHRSVFRAWFRIHHARSHTSRNFFGPLSAPTLTQVTHTAVVGGIGAVRLGFLDEALPTVLGTAVAWKDAMDIFMHKVGTELVQRVEVQQEWLRQTLRGLLLRPVQAWLERRGRRRQQQQQQQRRHRHSNKLSSRYSSRVGGRGRTAKSSHLPHVAGSMMGKLELAAARRDLDIDWFRNPYKSLIQDVDVVTFEEPRVVQMHALHQFVPSNLVAPPVTRGVDPEGFARWLLNQAPESVDVKACLATLLSTASASQLGKLSDQLHSAATYTADRRSVGFPDDLSDVYNMVRLLWFVCHVVWAPPPPPPLRRGLVPSEKIHPPCRPACTCMDMYGWFHGTCCRS